MKTCLVTTSMLDGNDGRGDSYLERNLRYLRWYLPLKDKLGFDKIIFIDNASSQVNIDVLKKEGGDDIIIHRSPERLLGGRFKHDYLYCWRGLYTLKNVIEHHGYEKLITVDNDGFILTTRLCEYVKNIKTGWEAFWCKKHNFPDSAIHVLCPDAHFKLFEFMKIPYADRNGDTMETSIPFSYICRTYNCDRFGEDSIEQSTSMDYYGQALLAQKLIFDMEKKV